MVRSWDLMPEREARRLARRLNRPKGGSINANMPGSPLEISISGPSPAPEVIIVPVIPRGWAACHGWSY